MLNVRLAIKTILPLLLVGGLLVSCTSLSRWTINAVAPNAISHLSCPSNKKILILTIDDAPHSDSTPLILEKLERHSAYATFFITGEQAKEEHEFLFHITNTGNEVANHDLSEKPSAKKTRQEFEADFSETHMVISPYIERHWFRPASGLYNADIYTTVEKHQHRIVLADIYSQDHFIRWNAFHAFTIKHLARNGSIVVLHDGKSHQHERGIRTAAILDGLLPALNERGFTVTSLARAIDKHHCEYK